MTKVSESTLLQCQNKWTAVLTVGLLLVLITK